MPSRCEWHAHARMEREDLTRLFDECDQRATVLVGTRDNWHLCEKHAAEPRFARMKKRPLIQREEQR